MAAAYATINVKVTGISSLDTLDKKLETNGTKFTGLKTKLAAVGLGAFARSAIMLADDCLRKSKSLQPIQSLLVYVTLLTM